MGINQERDRAHPEPLQGEGSSSAKEPVAEVAEQNALAEEGRPASHVPTGVTDAELPANLEQAYKTLLSEKREIYDQLLRKQAELENFRKRIVREKEDFAQHASAELVRDLLPLLDGFERALNLRNDDVPPEYYHGLELLYRELSEVLGRAGLTAIEVKGKIFDPHFHQAIETVESSEHQDHEIVEELQKGYKLKHRLLRPAIVKVAVRPAAPAPGGTAPKDPQV